MWIYPGGHYFDHGASGYSFTENFLSDLGRTTNFGRSFNPTAIWYRLTLSLAGLTTICFATGMFLKFKEGQPFASGFVLLTGVTAGLGYIGIANNPVNEHYFSHISYVQWGFLAFLAMSTGSAALLQNAPNIAKVHARIVWVFVAILVVQVSIMIFGPRSWSSYHALRMQVILQKVVVYAEMLTMSYLCVLLLRTRLKEGN